MMIRKPFAAAVYLPLVCILLLMPPTAFAAGPPGQEQELRERIRSHIEPDSVPPPAAGKIRSGIAFMIGGTGLGSAGIWAALRGLENRKQAITRYDAYMSLEYLDDPKAYDTAWEKYKSTEIQSMAYRYGGAAAVGTGIFFIVYGILSTRDAAIQSRELAEELDIELSQYSARRSTRLRLHPQGASLIWRY
ncbi:MAG: hypothetical protein ACOCVC_08925 [Spirochaeta sp.]